MTTPTPKKKVTWAELKKQGVERCCVVFKGGKRCRRRATEGSSWCAKHGPRMERQIKYYMDMAKGV